MVVSFCCIKCGNVTESGEIMSFIDKRESREIYEVGGLSLIHI